MTSDDILIRVAELRDRAEAEAERLRGEIRAAVVQMEQGEMSHYARLAHDRLIEAVEPASAERTEER